MSPRASHDRRGEAAPLDDWEPLETAASAVIARGCPWGLAVRSADLEAGEVSLEVGPAAKTGSRAAATRRWVAVRVTGSTLEYSIAPADLWLESATEAIRIDGGGAKAWVAELAEGESIHLRVRARGRGTLLGEAPVPVAARETIDVRAGAAIAHATIEACASAAPRAAAW